MTRTTLGRWRSEIQTGTAFAGSLAHRRVINVLVRSSGGMGSARALAGCG